MHRAERHDLDACCGIVRHDVETVGGGVGAQRLFERDGRAQRHFDRFGFGEKAGGEASGIAAIAGIVRAVEAASYAEGLRHGRQSRPRMPFGKDAGRCRWIGA